MRSACCVPLQGCAGTVAVHVLIGATPEGKKELLGFTDGARESGQDWRELLLDLKNRGLVIAPRLAIADGALGFWKAVGEVWPVTQEQCCSVHKTANVLKNCKKASSRKPNAPCKKLDGRDEEGCRGRLRHFHGRLPTELRKGRRRTRQGSRAPSCLLAFYGFPVEHWKHLRASNPIEKAFATVRYRIIRAKGCLSNTTALAMVFKLVEAAQKTWRRLDEHNQLAKIVLGVRFPDGLEVETANHQPKAAAWTSQAVTKIRL